MSSGKSQDEVLVYPKAAGPPSPTQHVNVRSICVQEIRVLNHVQIGSASLSGFTLQQTFNRVAAIERLLATLQREVKTITEGGAGGGGSGGGTGGGTGGGDGGTLPPADLAVIRERIEGLQTQIEALGLDLHALRVRVGNLEEHYTEQQLFLNSAFELVPFLAIDPAAQ